METRLEATRAWASVVRTTVGHLGPAVAVARFDVERAWMLQKVWAGKVLDRLGIDVHVDCRADLEKGNRGRLFVHLNQQTLLATALYAVSLPPCRFIVNVEYAALPIVGWASLALRGVPILLQ